VTSVGHAKLPPDSAYSRSVKRLKISASLISKSKSTPQLHGAERSTAKVSPPASELELGTGDVSTDAETGLRGFSSGSDSSDEDSDVAKIDADVINVAKLPTVAKDDLSVKRRLARAQKQNVVDRGVIYLGRIPHGFYEDEMRGYFSQFGEVTRVRLSRSKKTGRSKHYGFLEFASSAVAEIVCETMDNYLLCGHLLACKIIPKEEVHPELWIGANRKWRKVPINRVVRVTHNRERDTDELKRVEQRLLKRQRRRQRKIMEAGIEYDLTSTGYRVNGGN